jgi:PPOX class probable F420-dependent enzyme
VPYQCSDMNQAQIEEFLNVPRFAIVGTNRANGPPQLTPVWYLYQDDRIYLSMFVESAKYRNLCRDPRVGICITGDNPDARSVMIYGKADLALEGSRWVDEIVWKLTRRYYDSDQEARSYMDATAAEGESVLAVVTPEKIIAQDFN